MRTRAIKADLYEGSETRVKIANVARVTIAIIGLTGCVTTDGSSKIVRVIEIKF